MLDSVIGATSLIVVGLIASQAANADSFTFTTIDGPDAFETTAAAINDNGQIVGWYFSGSSLSASGFLLSGGNFSTYPFDIAGGEINGINNQGQVVGWNDGSGFLFSGGQLSTISAPGSNFTIANGINNSGQIVGEADITNPPAQPAADGFLFNGISFSIFSFMGYSIDPRGINDHGQIVGVANSDGFLLSNGTFSTFAFPGAEDTYFQGINNSDEIVGWYLTQTGYQSSIIYQGSFQAIDFPGAVDTQALGINNEGEIVGDYQDSGGEVHGFVATPIPEPVPLILCAIGLAGIGILMKGSRQRQCSSRRNDQFLLQAGK